mgnify:CR=1 FL=1
MPGVAHVPIEDFDLSGLDRSRTGNFLNYLILVGGDDVIPFYRHPDEAMLGPEQDFVPPVFDNTPSQASLRRNYFLSQDRYGARCEVSRGENPSHSADFTLSCAKLGWHAATK